MTEYPQAFVSKTRKARKAHTCCECQRTIAPGDRYQHSSGVWDSRPAGYKQCVDCHEIMRIAEAHTASYDDNPAFGILSEWFYDRFCDASEAAYAIGVEESRLSFLTFHVD